MAQASTNLNQVIETVHYRHGRILPPRISTNVIVSELAARPGVQPNNDALSGKSQSTGYASAWIRFPSGVSNQSFYLPFSARSLENAQNYNSAPSMFLASELETENVFPRFFLPPESIQELPETECQNEIIRKTGTSIKSSLKPPSRSTSLGVTLPPPVTVPVFLINQPSPEPVSAGTEYRNVIQDVLAKLNLPAATLEDDFDNEDNDEPLVDLVDRVNKLEGRIEQSPFHVRSLSPNSSAVKPPVTARELVKTRPRRHSVEKQPALV